MGNDLYWKITPKPVEEETNGLYLGTWYFLKELFKFIDKEDLHGVKLTKNDLEKLEIAVLTTKYSKDLKELWEDLEELMIAIRKYDSITLEIHG